MRVLRIDAGVTRWSLSWVPTITTATNASSSRALPSHFSQVCLLTSLPLPSNRHHRSSGDCLEGKGENYQVCSVQYCVQQLCTLQCTHIWTDVTGPWIGSCLTGPISLCLDSFFCMYYFVSDCTLHACVLCSIVTWWGGPGGIEAWSLGLLLPSVLWRCCLGHLTRKNPSLIWPIMCSVGR